MFCIKTDGAGWDITRQIFEMKKTVITLFLLIGMVVGTMVLCSYTTLREKETVLSTNININDEGWEYWTKVTAHRYYNPNDGNGWREARTEYRSNCEVQRRLQCGEKEYRIKIDNSWYPVHRGSVDNYSYYAIVGSFRYYFNI